LKNTPGSRKQSRYKILYQSRGSQYQSLEQNWAFIAKQTQTIYVLLNGAIAIYCRLRVSITII